MLQAYTLDATGVAQPLKRVNCSNEEQELQLLLEKNLNLLPGEQIRPGDPLHWLLIKREMPVP